MALRDVLDGVETAANVCRGLLRIMREVVVGSREAKANHARLPFTGRLDRRRRLSTRPRTSQTKFCDWPLRHVEIPFHPNNRLTIVCGHPVVLRLSVKAATDRALAGEPVVYLDGAQSFDPFIIGRLARVGRQQPRTILGLIHVARAFSGYQMERLISNCLAGAMERYQARAAVISGLCDMLNDETIADRADCAPLRSDLRIDSSIESTRLFLAVPGSDDSSFDSIKLSIIYWFMRLGRRPDGYSEEQGKFHLEEMRPLLNFTPYGPKADLGQVI